MIERIEIQGFRGIREGTVSGLTPLTLLTGVNGGGKSSVLDALLVACSPEPEDVLGWVVQRRPAIRNGARWLIWGGDEKNQACIIIHDGAGAEQTSVLNIGDGSRWQPAQRLAEENHFPPYRTVELFVPGEDKQLTTLARTVVAADGVYEVESRRHDPRAQRLLERTTRLLDPAQPRTLEEDWSKAWKAGRDKEATALLGALIPGFRDALPILEEGTWELVAMVGGIPLPVGLLGDGVRAAFQVALGLSSLTDGLALVEEPEVHLHPRAISLVAGVLVESARRGVQVVVSTHSLEMIDAIAFHAGKDRETLLSLQILSRKDGVLSAIRYSGAEMDDARNAAEIDLR